MEGRWVEDRVLGVDVRGGLGGGENGGDSQRREMMILGIGRAEV